MGNEYTKYIKYMKSVGIKNRISPDRENGWIYYYAPDKKFWLVDLKKEGKLYPRVYNFNWWTKNGEVYAKETYIDVLNSIFEKDVPETFEDFKKFIDERIARLKEYNYKQRLAKQEYKLEQIKGDFQ